MHEDSPLKEEGTGSAEPLVVVGAGAAGTAAAIAAARLGVRVSLLEKADRLGGTLAHSLIHTIGGLYDTSGEFMNSGLPVELADRLLQASPLTRMRRIGRTWTLSVSPEVYQTVVEAWVGEESKIEVFLKSEVVSVEADDCSVRRIESVNTGRRSALQPVALIDATGSAEAVRMIDPGLVVDNPRQAAGGLIFQMRGLEPGALKFPKNVQIVRAVRRAARDGALPGECAMAWIDTGVHEDEAYVKLFVPLSVDWRRPGVMAETTRKAERARDELAAFLAGRPGFSDARIIRTGSLGIRDGGRIEGEYCLTEADVREGRNFSDAACRCSWPIEYWDPETGVSLEHLPGFYEIPLRSLKVRNMKNLWAAGKCLSAEPRAQSSARVAGCCWAMGEAVGKAAVKDREACS